MILINKLLKRKTLNQVKYFILHKVRYSSEIWNGDCYDLGMCLEVT